MVRYSAANSGVSELMNDSGNCSVDLSSHELRERRLWRAGKSALCCPGWSTLVSLRLVRDAAYATLGAIDLSLRALCGMYRHM